jgi:acetolactate synthase-1/2/3 large subunit
MVQSAADVIAQRLYLAGCRYAFGIPGGEVLTIIDALERAGIRFVLTKHENAAGFMAEGAYHATGAPGIMVATVGPGIANGVNAVANASQEHIPLIVISGCIDAADRLTYTHQVFDHAAVLGPLCKATFQATPNACDVMIDKAIAIATDARPGPVHIDLPIAVAASPHATEARVMRRPVCDAAPAGGRDLEAARAMFIASKRPIMVVGADALNERGAKEAIRTFVDTYHIPVVTTYKAKGFLDETEPLCLGGHGLSPKSDRVVLPLLQRADLVICAGYDPIEMRPGWRQPWDPARAIEFSAAPNLHYMHQARYSWVCTIAAGLACLEREAAAPPWASDTREMLATLFAPQTPLDPEVWGPLSAIHTLRKGAPADTILTLDSGAHRILASQAWTCGEPRTLLQSTGLCTMGCALPLAAGFKLAAPEHPVIALMGDAGLDMTLGELTTVRDLQLPLIVVVFVDGSLSLIEAKQRASDMRNLGVDFGRTDYAAVAQALGAFGRSVSNEGDLAAALRDAFAFEGLSLIAVDIPCRAYDGLI